MGVDWSNFSGPEYLLNIFYAGREKNIQLCIIYILTMYIIYTDNDVVFLVCKQKFAKFAKNNIKLAFFLWKRQTLCFALQVRRYSQPPNTVVKWVKWLQMNTTRCCPDGVLLAVAVGVFVAVAVCVAVAVPVVVAVGVAVSVGEDVPDGVPVAVVVGLAVRVGVWVLAAEGGGREGAHADRTGMERENPQHIKKQLVAYVWVSEHRFWWCACVWALLNLGRRMKMKCCFVVLMAF